jgi:hypothetical protein
MELPMTKVAYWLFTLIVAFEMLAGSMWDLLQIDYVRSVFAHLGYPSYLLFILGAWKLPCGVVWLLPRLPRLKEWAYAGGFFTYSGAAARISSSATARRYGPGRWCSPSSPSCPGRCVRWTAGGSTPPLPVPSPGSFAARWPPPCWWLRS